MVVSEIIFYHFFLYPLKFLLTKQNFKVISLFTRILTSVIIILFLFFYFVLL